MVRDQFIKGTIEMVVLSLLNRKDMHGYLITQELRAKSPEFLGVKEGTLYPLLMRLERRGLVRGRWERPVGKRRQHVYSITDKGRKGLKERKSMWSGLTRAVRLFVPTPA
ncbi:MAG: hypothetical protein A3G34_05080 [Candidatus Lindowbacteria bacterium RIFCSPLOWO2_12_FULL_62_27]|nr:MAG: hypothetical protein A3I06_07395 [Candidatus Lindowbacteria bacterium RIFCSPLOWO2_02_FULL_62_12]OGH61363.1 MAG: hypothetical protein A3G34_05080 [Candidatus Lindowbacteria bacterium RIFCSPLOWO2_12_FULL_62_27]